MKTAAFKKGQAIDGRYRLQEPLGKGGFSRVWLASGNNGRQVALKFYSPGPGLEEYYRSVLDREYELLSTLDHPNLLKALEKNTAHQPNYVALEYLAGGNLKDRLEKATLQSGHEIAAFLVQVGSVLDYLHNRKKLVHGDLKPENILISPKGDYVLCDFGTFDHKYSTQAWLAKSQYHASPEHYENDRLSPASDIFSMGVIIFEMCQGLWSPNALPAYDLVRLNLQTPSIDLEIYAQRLQKIIEACWRKDPAARPTAMNLYQYGTFYLQNQFWPELDVDRRTVVRMPEQPKAPPPPPRHQPKPPVHDEVSPTVRGKRRLLSPRAARRIAATAAIVASLFGSGAFAWKNHQGNYESLIAESLRLEQEGRYSDAYDTAEEASLFNFVKDGNAQSLSLMSRIRNSASTLWKDTHQHSQRGEYYLALNKIDTMQSYVPTFFKAKQLSDLEKTLKWNLSVREGDEAARNGRYAKAARHYREALELRSDEKVQKKLDEVNSHL